MSETFPETVVDEAPDPLAPDENAPYGYTVDRASGERRPKKTAGRPKAAGDGEGLTPGQGESPSVESLRTGTKVSRETDRTPTHKHTSRFRAQRNSRTKADRSPKEAPDVPPFRAGPIAKGMNGLYAKVGKIIKVMDPEVGSAILSCTRKESDDDVTVGEAWEEIAKVNPRIRAFLLKMITGGAWTQLFMAHAPIFLAVVMKPAVAKHIPFMGIVDAMLTEEDGTPSAEAQAAGGLTPEDTQQMMGVAQQMAEQMGMGGIDIAGLMRNMNGGQRQPTPGGDQYGGFQAPEDNSGG